MKKSVFMDKYPVYETTLSKEQSNYSSVESIIAYFKDKIEKDKIAAYIGEFDPYRHTSSIGGEIHPDIIQAKEIIFCFGQKLPNATIVAVRPRTIGVVELKDSFVINFMEAPNEPSTNTMISWVKELLK
ncbi:MAG: hypothetical protein U9N49_11455 [Campylobacterota bacterium]|nr:hypothetical protein [Campylobacterota bacterium]